VSDKDDGDKEAEFCLSDRTVLGQFQISILGADDGPSRSAKQSMRTAPPTSLPRIGPSLTPARHGKQTFSLGKIPREGEANATVLGKLTGFGGDFDDVITDVRILESSTSAMSSLSLPSPTTDSPRISTSSFLEMPRATSAKTSLATGSWTSTRSSLTTGSLTTDSLRGSTCSFLEAPRTPSTKSSLILEPSTVGISTHRPLEPALTQKVCAFKERSELQAQPEAVAARDYVGQLSLRILKATAPHSVSYEDAEAAPAVHRLS